MHSPAPPARRKVVDTPMIIAMVAVLLLAVVTVVVLVNKDDGGGPAAASSSATPSTPAVDVAADGEVVNATTYGLAYSYPKAVAPFDETLWESMGDGYLDQVQVEQVNAYQACQDDAGNDLIFGFAWPIAGSIDAAATFVLDELSDSVWSDTEYTLGSASSISDVTTSSGLTGKRVERTVTRTEPDECGSQVVKLVSVAFENAEGKLVVFFVSRRTDGDMRNSDAFYDDVADQMIESVHTI